MVFRVAPQKKSLMVSNRKILVAADVAATRNASRNIVFARVVWYAAPSCRNHICSKSYSSIATKKVNYHMTTMLWIDGDSCSIVIFEEVWSNHTFGQYTKQWLFLDVMASFQLVEDTTILFINISTECEMFFIAEKNFVRKITVQCLLLKHPIHVSTTLWLVSSLQLLRGQDFIWF